MLAARRRETLDVNADNRLPASHRFLFLVNSLLLSAAVVYLYSEIFDMNIEENVVIFGAVSVVSAVMLTMACQSRAKKLIARLISKRGIELLLPSRDSETPRRINALRIVGETTHKSPIATEPQPKV